MGHEHERPEREVGRPPNFDEDSSDGYDEARDRTYLKEPNKKKENQSNSAGNIHYTATSMQGWRKTQEDSHMSHTDLPGGVHLFGVFDGHGGLEVSLWVKENFKNTLVEL
jgi:hypothetical protein